MIRGLSGTAIAEHGAGMGSGDDGERQGEVKDLEHGVIQGGKVRIFGVLLGGQALPFPRNLSPGAGLWCGAVIV